MRKTIYGVRSAYSPCHEYFIREEDAIKRLDYLNKKHPKSEYRIERAYLEDGNTMNNGGE